MNRIYALLALCFTLGFATPAWAQLFEENFNYTAGDSLTGQGYAVTSGGTTNTIKVTSPGLTYTGYPSSGIGNAATLVNTGQDLNKSMVLNVRTGSIYGSFLVRVDSARTGDYFFHLLQPPNTSNIFIPKVWVKMAGNGNLAFGVSKRANIPNLTDSIYTLGTTYLIVVKYTFVTGTTNDDQVSLFVFTDPTLPASEPPTPTVGPITETAGTDATSITFVCLRQGTTASAPNLVIDGIRVGRSWEGTVLNQPFSVVTPTSIAFGNVTVGTGKTDTITIKNMGASTLSISGVTSSGSAFVPLPTSGSIAPLDSAKFTLTFSPPAPTGHGATIVFTTNTAKGSDTVTATGNGVQAGFSVAPKSIAFGLVLATTTKQDSVIVSNASNAVQLVVDSVKSDNPAFVPLPVTATIDTMSDQVFTIDFTPPAKGHETGKIIFYHNAASKQDTVTVSGDGYIIEPIFSATPSSVNFGRVFPGSPKSENVTVRNIGYDSLFIASVTTTDPQFTVTPLTARIDTNKTQVFQFTFSPSASGTSNALVIFGHNGSKGYDTVAVTGIGELVTSLLEAVKDTNGDRKPDNLNDTMTVIGVVNSVNVQVTSNNMSYYIQDDTAGINLFAFGAAGTVFKVGDKVRATGVIQWYRGTTEIITANPATDITVIDTAQTLKVVDVTLPKYLSNPEPFESRLIRFTGVAKKPSSVAWPSGTDANMWIWNGKDTLTLRVDVDTDLPTYPEPLWPVTIKGVATQFTSSSSVANNGYQMTPMFYADIVQNVQVPPRPEFALSAPTNGKALWIFPDLTYAFSWKNAIDLNGADTLKYKLEPIGQTPVQSGGNGLQTSLTLNGSTMLSYLVGDSLALRWTVLVNDGHNPDVASIDTFTVILRRGVLTPGWTNQAFGSPTSLSTVKAVNQGVAWAGGYDNSVLLTVNGGATWTNVAQPSLGTEGIWNIDAVDENTAFVTTSPSGAPTYIFRTTNAGATWDTVYKLTGGFMDGIHMWDAQTGMAVGDPVGGTWVVLRTTNGGANWTRIGTEPTPTSGEAGWNNSIAAVGTKFIVFGSNKGHVYRSNDKGATWQMATVPMTDVTGLAFVDTVYGVAIGKTGSTAVLARTADGGLTWTAGTFPGTGSFWAPAAGGGKKDFWVGRGANIYRSTDRGATWSLEFSMGGTGAMQHMSFVTYGASTSGWAVSDDGRIAAAYFSTVTGLAGPTSMVPETFALEQNYPNPFNPSTTIRYGLPTAAHVSLKIYNVLGQLIATLRDESQTAGTYTMVWQGTNDAGARVASGVYFYHLEATPANGNQTFVNNKKMVLLK